MKPLFFLCWLSLFSGALPLAALASPARTHKAPLENSLPAPHHHSVLALFGPEQSLCTGTLITPNLVLTARHCVSPYSPFKGCPSTWTEPLPPEQIQLVGSFDTEEIEHDKTRSILEIYTPPSDQVCGADLAILKLRRPIALQEAVPRVPRIDEMPTKGETYTALGYGYDPQSGGGHRRISTDLAVECTGDACAHPERVGSQEFRGSRGPCEGDSGGPALDKHGRIMGVLARTGQFCTSSVYTDPAAHADWLREIVLQESEQPPSWALGESTLPPTGDPDRDGIPNGEDLCPDHPDPLQIDTDQDGLGDLCDPYMDPLPEKKEDDEKEEDLSPKNNPEEPWTCAATSLPVSQGSGLWLWMIVGVLWSRRRRKS